MISGSHYLLTDWVLFSQVALHHDVRDVLILFALASKKSPMKQQGKKRREKKQRLHSKHTSVKQAVELHRGSESNVCFAKELPVWAWRGSRERTSSSAYVLGPGEALPRGAGCQF